MPDLETQPRPAIPQVLVLGASGAVGSILLDHLLASPYFGNIRTLGRRELPQTSPRLESRVFEKKLDEIEPNFFAVDAVFSCLGAYPQASLAETEWVEYELPRQVASICQTSGARQFLLLSCHQAQSARRNPRLLQKMQLAEDLNTLGFPQVHIFKPGVLLSNRPVPRWGEDLRRLWYTALGPMLSGKNRPLALPTLARYMLMASLKSWPETNVVHGPHKMLRTEKKVFDFQTFEEKTQYRDLD